ECLPGAHCQLVKRRRVSDEFELSDLQRDRLSDFIGRADAIIGDGSFNPEAEYIHPELMALALRAAQISGYEGTHLDELFRQEFELAGVTEGDLGDWLAIVMLADVEARIKAAAGGRN